MSPPKPDPLRQALEAAAGREDESAVDRRLLAWARALRDARRGVLDAEPCPPALLHRLRAIPAARGSGVGPALLRLVYDSWTNLAPAVRGGRPPRALRFEAEDRALDLRLVREEGGGLLVQIATEPEREGLSASVEVGGVSRPVAADLDDSGAGQVRVPASGRQLRVTVRADERVVMRTPTVGVE